MKIKSKRGFTLIEMLIVVAIIGLLATVVLFAVARARKKAVATQMEAHMVEIMKGIEMAATDGITEISVIGDGSMTNGEAVGSDAEVIYVRHIPTRPNDECGYFIGEEGDCDSIPSADSDFNDSVGTADYAVCASGFDQTTGVSEYFMCEGGSCWCTVAGGCLATP